MAGRDFAQPWVQKALSQGLGPTEALRIARAGGLRIREGEWFRAYGQERMNLALEIRNRAAPLNRRPTADELGRWTTVRRRGFAYRVVGILQDRETGASKTQIITVTTDSLVSRGRAIKMAVEAFIDPEEKYPAALIAAFNAGVFEMTPGQEEE